MVSSCSWYKMARYYHSTIFKCASYEPCPLCLLWRRAGREHLWTALGGHTGPSPRGSQAQWGRRTWAWLPHWSWYRYLPWLSVFECGRVHVVETSQSSLHMRNITHVASYLPDPAAALLKVGSQSAVHLKHKYTRQELTRLTHPVYCLTKYFYC